ncbi:MAG TPA: MarR family transcriptional regulator [Acidimicrobiia bacterium]|nr:MarR family transcriptional regulator [Acidimicrobiia bacterium]
MDQVDAWSALVTVYQSVLHDVVRALEDDAGMDSGVFSALAYLARAEPRGRMRLSELLELMHPRYSQPGLSRLVQRMEADGLVERHADPDDGRATVLQMTRAGRTRFARADAIYTAAVREHFGQHLSVTEACTLRSSLDAVLRARATSGSRSRTVRAR